MWLDGLYRVYGSLYPKPSLTYTLTLYPIPYSCIYSYSCIRFNEEPGSIQHCCPFSVELGVCMHAACARERLARASR